MRSLETKVAAYQAAQALGHHLGLFARSPISYSRCPGPCSACDNHWPNDYYEQAHDHANASCACGATVYIHSTLWHLTHTLRIQSGGTWTYHGSAVETRCTRQAQP